MEITGAPTGLDSAQATLIESRPMHIGRGLRGNWQCGRGQGQMRGLGGIRGQGWVCDQGSRNNRGILQRKSDVCRWTRTGVQTVSESVKDLQSLEMLDNEPEGCEYDRVSGSMVQRRGSSPNETEDEKNLWDRKRKTKTRLVTNYSYWVILIVEDAQPIVNMYTWGRSYRSHCTAFGA